MNLRFLVCSLVASLSHIGILFVLPNRTPPVMRTTESDFSVEILPTQASNASVAAATKPPNLPSPIAPTEFKSTRPMDPSEWKPDRHSPPMREPSRPLGTPTTSVPAADITPVFRQVYVDVLPIEPPPIHFPKPSHAGRTSPAAPLEKKGTRTVPRIGGDFHPAYPDEARRLGLEGTVVVEIVVSEVGEVKIARIDRSSGHDLLDQAALRDVLKAQFQPGRIGDEPSEMKALLPLSYRLIGGP